MLINIKLPTSFTEAVFALVKGILGLQILVSSLSDNWPVLKDLTHLNAVCMGMYLSPYLSHDLFFFWISTEPGADFFFSSLEYQSFCPC